MWEALFGSKHSAMPDLAVIVLTLLVVLAVGDAPAVHGRET